MLYSHSSGGVGGSCDVIESKEAAYGLEELTHKICAIVCR